MTPAIRFKALFPPQDRSLAEHYIALLKERMCNGEGALFHAVEVPDLVERGACICAALASTGPMAGMAIGFLHYVIDGAPTQQIMGLVVHPTARGAGIGTSLIAFARCHAATASGGALPAACVVRVLPDGQINIASQRAFLRAGFVVAETLKIPISGTPTDAHLAETQEPNGFYRAQRLRAGAETIDIAANLLWGTATCRSRKAAP